MALAGAARQGVLRECLGEVDGLDPVAIDQIAAHVLRYWPADARREQP